MTKICYTCKEEKPLDDFHRRKRSPDGRCCKCKQCVAEYNIQYRIDTKKHSQKWHKEYYGKNQTERLEYAKQYRVNNPERAKEIEHNRWLRDKKKRMARNKIYVAKNPDKMRAIWKRSAQKKRQKVEYRLTRSLSRLIHKALKENKEGGRWRIVVGYTVAELKQHLESQFIDGMTWDNYGKWHIDHKIPQSFFQFSSLDDVEFRMCWRLENLQPLWATDNIRKGNDIKAVA